MHTLKRIGFYGVSGVGKTTTLSIFSKCQSNTIWLEGTELVLEAANLSLPEFKKLPESEKYFFREKAICRAFEIQKTENQHIIIDGHLAFPKNENDFEDVMTEMDKIFYTDFIYLKLSPKIILGRQQNDILKRRNYSIETISNWIDFEVTKLQKVCFERNINLLTIESENTDDYVKSILKTINNA